LFLPAQPLPPRRERIDNEVARLGRIAEGHRQLGGVFIQNPTRNILFGVAKVVVTRFKYLSKIFAVK
jgi:hypothetical protein